MEDNEGNERRRNVFVKEKEGSKMKKRTKEEEIEKGGRRSG